MRLRLLLLIFTLPLFLPCYAETETSADPMAELEAKLKTWASKHYEDYQLCEVFSKNGNKARFFEKTIGSDFVAAVEKVTSRELFVKDLAATVPAHIGFAVFHYKDQEAAKKAIEKVKPEGFLQETKILTPYVLTNCGDTNILVYSESAADELIEGFMTSLSF